MILIAAIRDRFARDKDTRTADLVEQESLVSEDRKTHDKTTHFISIQRIRHIFKIGFWLRLVILPERR